MKRSDLKELGIEDKAVIDSIMELYGTGINEAKTDVKKLEDDIKDKDKSISDLNETIKSFDGTEGTLKELQDKVATYEKTEADRQESEKQKQIDADLKNRFTSVVGENKFKHEDIENGRFGAFKTALADEKYKGKGDADVLADVIKDMDCFVNPQRATITMPSGGGTIPKDLAQAKTFDEYKAIRKAQN